MSIVCLLTWAHLICHGRKLKTASRNKPVTQRMAKPFSGYFKAKTWEQNLYLNSFKWLIKPNYFILNHSN